MALALLLVACKKEEAVDGGSSGTGLPQLYPWLHLAVDSSCLVTGNVFTPNYDGINDVLAITAINVTDVIVKLTHMNGAVIYDGDLAGAWDPSLLPAPVPTDAPLRLVLTVTGISTSGHVLSGTSIIYSVSAPLQQCFSSAVAPVTPDQFMTLDQMHLACEPLCASNDIFCLQ